MPTKERAAKEKAAKVENFFADGRVNKQHVVDAARLLSIAFCWESSPEGYTYWSTVYNKLRFYATATSRRS